MTTHRSWFRPARGLPPEATFILALGILASLLYLAVAPRSPAAPPSITDVAPRCSDAPRPCKGGLS